MPQRAHILGAIAYPLGVAANSALLQLCDLKSVDDIGKHQEAQAKALSAKGSLEVFKEMLGTEMSEWCPDSLKAKGTEVHCAMTFANGVFSIFVKH